jgi:hypothetical protein
MKSKLNPLLKIDKMSGNYDPGRYSNPYNRQD